MGPLADPSHSDSQEDRGNDSWEVVAVSGTKISLLSSTSGTMLPLCLWPCSPQLASSLSAFTWVRSLVLWAPALKVQLEFSCRNDPLFFWRTCSFPGLPLLGCASPLRVSESSQPQLSSWGPIPEACASIPSALLAAGRCEHMSCFSVEKYHSAQSLWWIFSVLPSEHISHCSPLWGFKASLTRL